MADKKSVRKLDDTAVVTNLVVLATKVKQSTGLVEEALIALEHEKLAHSAEFSSDYNSDVRASLVTEMLDLRTLVESRLRQLGPEITTKVVGGLESASRF